MKKSIGFSLLEFMFALCIGSIICTAILLSYKNVYKIYLNNIDLLIKNHDLLLAIQLIKRDAQKSGFFGAFSFHHQHFSLYHLNSSPNPLCKESEFCDFKQKTVGITSNIHEQVGIIRELSLIPDSEILKIQYGTEIGKLIIDDELSCQASDSCVITKCNDFYYFNNLYFSDDIKDFSSSVYMLSAVNRAYLLKFNDVTRVKLENEKLHLKLASNGCPKHGEPFAQIYAMSKVEDKFAERNVFDPDIFTISLSKLNTIYYFVAKGIDDNSNGLYMVKLQDGGLLSLPILVSDKVNSIRITYILDFNVAFNRQHSDANRFVVCSTHDMLSNSVCNGNWEKIVAANITLIARNKNGINYQITETVSWRP